MINLDEPLVHRAEDDGRFAAPAVRIAVMIIFLVQQGVAGAEFVQHGFVRVAFAVLFENGFADHFRRHLLLDRQIVRVGELAVVVHRRINRQADCEAEIVVFQAVAGRDVDEAGAGVAGDKIGGDKLCRCDCRTDAGIATLASSFGGKRLFLCNCSSRISRPPQASKPRNTM